MSVADAILGPGPERPEGVPATESAGSGKAGTSPPATVVGVPSSVKLQMAIAPLIRRAAASYAKAASSAESKVPSQSLQLCSTHMLQHSEKGKPRLVGVMQEKVMATLSFNLPFEYVGQAYTAQTV